MCTGIGEEPCTVLEIKLTKVNLRCHFGSLTDL
jgi:hypothetical protein